MTDFSALNLADPLDRALRELGHGVATPIQAQAIPEALKGRDILGIAQTGTGKTAAFTLPLLHHIFTKSKDVPKRGARVLILVPTRELADQITLAVRDYGRHIMDLSVSSIFGGIPINRQIKRLVYGKDVIVATPGRLIDLLDRKAINIDEVEILVLDEADQMMDMGFIHALKKIIPLLPQKRQTLFFSATLAPKIKSLSQQFLSDPIHISVSPANTTAEKIEQRVYRVNQADKQSLLSLALLNEDVGRSLVFTRTKHGADRIVKRLAQVGILAIAIHGNKSQGQRQRALQDYRSRKVNILVATDIAARGIDIPDITHVFNYEIPNVPEQYVHRIGRTARAQQSGIAVSLVDKSEEKYLRDIEKLLKQKLPVMDMPGDMSEKLKSLSSRKALPTPEKPKPDPRKGRGKSKKKARFSRSDKSTSAKSDFSEGEVVDAKEKHARFKKHTQTHPKKKTQKYEAQFEASEGKRSRKALRQKQNSDTAKSIASNPIASSEPSAEGKSVPPNSRKGHRGKTASKSNKNHPKKSSKKIKPSRTKRKANRQTEGKTKPR